MKAGNSLVARSRAKSYSSLSYSLTGADDSEELECEELFVVVSDDDDEEAPCWLCGDEGIDELFASSSTTVEVVLKSSLVSVP